MDAPYKVQALLSGEHRANDDGNVETLHTTVNYGGRRAIIDFVFDIPIDGAIPNDVALKQALNDLRDALQDVTIIAPPRPQP